MERKARAATQTGIYLLLVAAILVVANVISFSAYKRFDTTAKERFTLSKGSGHLVSEGLKQDLNIEIYVTRGLPKVEAYIENLIDLMREYERASGGKLHYSIIEAKTEEQRQAAKDAGLQEMMLGEGSETGTDQTTISRGFMGMALKYGSEKEALPLQPGNAEGLEFWISNKIRELRDRADNITQKYGVITGKDEIKLTDANLIAAQPGRGGGPSMKQILDQAFPFYKIEEVDLQGGDAEINKELVGIIITQPGKDYTEKELRRIDQFLMLGNKAVAIFASAVNMKAADASMKAELNTHGLDKLLEGYGIEMKKEAIIDWGSPVIVQFQTPTGQVGAVNGRGMVQAQYNEDLEDNQQMLDKSFPGFFRVEQGVSFPFPSPLVPHPEKQPAEIKVVARSSERSAVDASEAIDLKYTEMSKPKGDGGARVIAVSLEGKIKSAFGGQAGDSGITAPAESADRARLLVMSSSEFLANPYARAGNPPPMPPQMAMMGGMGGDEELQFLSQFYAQKYLTTSILVFKNILDWMSGDTDLIASSTKLMQEPNLSYANISKPIPTATDDEASWAKKKEEYQSERKRTQQWVQWTLIFLGPALFAAFGLFRWRRRESARESIRLD